jgi:MoaA/NifB/PqqE/SkfB family radical SAM enzyme/Fe-S-cluster containining protein
MGFGINFEVTNACNLRCKTCLPASAKARPAELTSDQIVDFIRKLHGRGAESVLFTGGEPFSRQDFLSIIEEAGKLSLRISVITNGMYVSPEIITTLKRNRVGVGVSLDGSEPRWNDEIRGKGVFANVIKAIRQFVDAGLHVTLNVTLTRQNFEFLIDFALMAEQVGCSKVLFNEVVRGGRAEDHWGALALTAEQQRQLPKLFERAAKSVFGDQIEGTDDRCWVDGSSVYINSEGFAYLCSEIFQRRPDLAVANVKSDAGIHTLLDSMATKHGHRACCYQVLASEHITLIANLDRRCALVELEGKRAEAIIHNLMHFRSELDELWKGIGQSCATCTDPDCLGYVWVMPEEEEALLDAGVRTVQINGLRGPIFIDSYHRDAEGRLIVNRTKPNCPYRDKDGRCSVHAARPLVCHLYPLGPETLPDGRVIWSLHTDCSHVRSLTDAGDLPLLVSKIRRLLSRMSPDLKEKIRDQYGKVDAVSAFPEGPNNFITIEEISL